MKKYIGRLSNIYTRLMSFPVVTPTHSARLEVEEFIG